MGFPEAAFTRRALGDGLNLSMTRNLCQHPTRTGHPPCTALERLPGCTFSSSI